MARQKGVVKLKGTVGGVSFYKGKEGYLAREAGKVPGEMIKHDPRFQRTRENNAEFIEAARATDLFCDAFKDILDRPGWMGKSDFRARLTREMLKVLRTDTVSPRGERKVHLGNVELLRGFEFRKGVSFKNLCAQPFQVDLIDEVNWWKLKYTFEPVIPERDISVPSHATHFELIGCGGAIDFVNGTHEMTTSSSGNISIDHNGANIQYYFYAWKNVNYYMFLAFRIVFKQLINGKLYPLRNEAFNAISVVYAKRLQ